VAGAMLLRSSIMDALAGDILGLALHLNV